MISIGYKVNSKRATQFRIWATQTLKDHLIKGYTINEKRLQEQQEKWKELQQTVEFLKRTMGKKELNNKETQGLLEIISQYTRSFVLLSKFDNESLEATSSEKKLTYEIKYKEAVTAIEELKKNLLGINEASDLLGRQREVSKAYYEAWYKPLAENTCTQQLKSRQHTCFILLLKTTHLQMATIVLEPFIHLVLTAQQTPSKKK